MYRAPPGSGPLKAMAQYRCYLVDSANGIFDKTFIESDDEAAALVQANKILALNNRAERMEIWLGPYLVRQLTKNGGITDGKTTARLTCVSCKSVYECAIEFDLIPEVGSFECEGCGSVVLRWKTFRPFSEFKLVKGNG